jgi:hypothetical protein
MAADIQAQLAPALYFGGEYLKSSGELSDVFAEEDLPTLGIEYDEGMNSVTVEISLPTGMYLALVQDGAVVGVLDDTDPIMEIEADKFFAATKRLENKESGEWR